MWLFCERGYFSIVEDESNRENVVVRAHVELDIERFKWLMVNGCSLPMPEIEKATGRHYPYRIRLKKADWAIVAAKLAGKIDYGSFEDSVVGSRYRRRAYREVSRAMQKYKETYHEFLERHLKPDGDEHNILTTCALRFKGWQYREKTGFDHENALEQFWRKGEWSLSPQEELTVFFMLQRFLCKWGGEHEPPYGNYWRAFRSLFLRVWSHTIPAEYQNPEYMQEWRVRYVPRLKEVVDIVRLKHETIEYDDHAEPLI